MKGKILPYIVLPIFIFLFTVCNRKQGNEVIFKETTINSLTSLIDHIQAIRLEHGDSILIGRNPLVFQRDSSFYLVDRKGQKKIYRFALDGHFLNTIGTKGSGPGEYMNINKVIVDEKEDNVFILSSNIYVYWYSKEGVFKERLSQTDLQIQDFIKQDSVFWIHTLNANYDTLYLLRTNLQLRALDTLMVPLPKAKDISLHRFASMLFHFNILNNKICFSAPPYPVIYEIEKNRVREKIGFRFVPKEFASRLDLENSGNNQLLDFRSLQLLASFHENEDFLFIDFQCGGRKQGYQFIQAIQNKYTGEWNWCAQPISESNFKKIPWYLGRLCGFSKDGALMCYLPAPQPLVAYESIKDKIVNPELFTTVNEDMDMYIFLCYLKPPCR